MRPSCLHSHLPSHMLSLLNSLPAFFKTGIFSHQFYHGVMNCGFFFSPSYLVFLLSVLGIHCVTYLQIYRFHQIRKILVIISSNIFFVCSFKVSNLTHWACLTNSLLLLVLMIFSCLHLNAWFTMAPASSPLTSRSKPAVNSSVVFSHYKCSFHS